MTVKSSSYVELRKEVAYKHKQQYTNLTTKCNQQRDILYESHACSATEKRSVAASQHSEAWNTLRYRNLLL